MRKKLVLIGFFLSLAACTPPRPYSPAPIGSTSTPSAETGAVSPPSPPESKTTHTLSQDASDCERQAALSTVGTKAEAFNNCMKARRGANP